MRIVVDIGHPAHIHYFKNFIWEMEKRGHQILMTVTEKEITYSLLDNYKFNYIKMGSQGRSLVRKMANIPIMNLKMLIAVKDFRPDLFLGFGSIRAAHAAWLLHKPCINFEDTEHSIEQIRLYLPFVPLVLTPSCFNRDLGKKQIRFNGYMELGYLHPSYFTPDSKVLDEIGLTRDEIIIIVRFVSWTATHDRGHKGIENQLNVIKILEKHGRVFISSEKPLIKELEKYRIRISLEKIHHLMYYATLLYSESATMTSECAVLGTHAIFNDFAGRGYTDEEERVYDLVYNYRLDKDSQKKSLEKAESLLDNYDLRKEGKEKQKNLLRDKINVTDFMVWFIENYPYSYKEMKQNPEIQTKFK